MIDCNKPVPINKLIVGKKYRYRADPGCGLPQEFVVSRVESYEGGTKFTIYATSGLCGEHRADGTYIAGDPAWDILPIPGADYPELEDCAAPAQPRTRAEIQAEIERLTKSLEEAQAQLAEMSAEFPDIEAYIGWEADGKRGTLFYDRDLDYSGWTHISKVMVIEIERIR